MTNEPLCRVLPCVRTPAQSFVLATLIVASVLYFDNALAQASTEGPSPRHRKAKSHLCENELRQNELVRYFRSQGDFLETDTGVWIFRASGPAFARDGEERLITGPAINAASHAEIIRRMVGEARYSAILNAVNPDAALDESLEKIARAQEDVETVLEADEVKAEIEKLADSAPLPHALEVEVMTVLKQMGRLASPMSTWLEPKLRSGVLTQMKKDLIEGPIESQLATDVLIYKAVEVTVLLDGPKTFILSAGEKGYPDRVHQMLLEALEMVLPQGRLKKSTPGYLVIHTFSSKNPLHGHIEFQGKTRTKTVLQSENFDFK